MKKKYVTMEKDGDTGEVMPESVKLWERNGWTVVDDRDSGVEEDPAPLTPANGYETNENVTDEETQ